MPFEYEELRAKTQQTLVEFLNAETQPRFNLCAFRAEIARDAGHMERFERTKLNAAKGIQTVRRFMTNGRRCQD
jgi:hypothetical protein